MSGTESLLSVVIAHAETTLKNKGSSIVVEKGQIVNVTKDKNGIENEWQSFRTKKDRSLELKSVFHECTPGRRKVWWISSVTTR
jgi:hypothetical protein